MDQLCAGYAKICAGASRRRRCSRMADRNTSRARRGTYSERHDGRRCFEEARDHGFAEGDVCTAHMCRFKRVLSVLARRREEFASGVDAAPRPRRGESVHEFVLGAYESVRRCGRARTNRHRRIPVFSIVRTRRRSGCVQRKWRRRRRRQRALRRRRGARGWLEEIAIQRVVEVQLDRDLHAPRRRWSGARNVGVGGYEARADVYAVASRPSRVLEWRASRHHRGIFGHSSTAVTP